MFLVLDVMDGSTADLISTVLVAGALAMIARIEERASTLAKRVADLEADVKALKEKVK